MMTSKSGCYVYIQLPKSLEVVTCARFERFRLQTGEMMGRFFYGQSYLARPDAVAIDPVHLPLQRGPLETHKLGGMFGAIRDASPDYWGRLVIERAVERSDLDEMDFLLHSPEDRAGALSFGLGQNPPAPVRAFNKVIQLKDLLAFARTVENPVSSRDPLHKQLQDIISPGTSLGGARPKNVVEDDDGLWIAKFPARQDRWNNAPVEAGLLALAKRCGIPTPETRIVKIGSDDVLLVKRFDREQAAGSYLRHRMVSSLTVLNAEESPTERSRWSYVLLADELQRWSVHNKNDKQNLFRRMVFNALVSNLDDHPRNHALIAPGSGWQLAPAYDITPSPAHSIERRDLALTCGLYGRMARRVNMVSEAARFGLTNAEANSIIDDMKHIVGTHWEIEIRRQGGTAEDCDKIRSAFLYEGFEYTVE